MRFVKCVLVICILGIAVALSAQEKKVQFQVGSGQTGVSDDFQQERYDVIKGSFFTMGAVYSKSSKGESLDLGAGLSLAYRSIENLQLMYIRAPVSIDFRFGNVFQPTLGGGAACGFLVYSNVDAAEYPLFETTKNDFQFDLFVRGGFIYKLNPAYSLKIRYTYEFDVAPAFNHNRAYGHGPASSLSFFGREQYITLGFDITLSEKNPTKEF